MTALEQALLDKQDDAFPATLDPPSLAAAIGVGQPAASAGSAQSSNAQQDETKSSSGRQDETKGSSKGANGQKVKAWEASTPDAAIAAADSFGYNGLIELKRVNHQSNTQSLPQTAVKQ